MRDAEAAHQEEQNSFLCYNWETISLAIWKSVLKEPKTYWVQAEWIHHFYKDSVIVIIVFATSFSGDWVKKLSISLNYFCFRLKLDSSQPKFSNSGLAVLALTVLQSPKNLKADIAPQQRQSLRQFFSLRSSWHQDSVNAVSHSAMLCFSIKPLIFQSYGQNDDNISNFKNGFW